VLQNYIFLNSFRPSLPPSKQANKNLILKAISEAQESVTRTTNYSAGNLDVMY
jgi:tRNA U34 5-methylaminomethyl-2-thiouridine-forming methyltransferase MnmC